MNDRAVSLLELYDLEVESTGKGRDAILAKTDKGLVILKEYRGPKERLSVQKKILDSIAENEDFNTEKLFATKEEELFVKDKDGTIYILKSFAEGRECDTANPEEIKEAIVILAKLHKCMCFSVENAPCEDVTQVRNVLQDYEKKNRELQRIRNYLIKKSQRTDFERQLLAILPYFQKQALEVTKGWAHYQEMIEAERPKEICFCHGDYQYHNLIKTEKGWFLTNFEKYVADSPIRDLYLLLRKMMEKTDWSISLGKEMIKTYENAADLSVFGKIDLFYRLSYPDKFWKIANFYYNTAKSFLSPKNSEKLCKLLDQEEKRKTFLEEVFQIS